MGLFVFLLWLEPNPQHHQCYELLKYGAEFFIAQTLDSLRKSTYQMIARLQDVMDVGAKMFKHALIFMSHRNDSLVCV